MNTSLNVKRKDGKKVLIKLKELDLSYIDQIMELQSSIMDGIQDKQLYSPSNREEFIKDINSKAAVIGYVTEENMLIAMGIYVEKGYERGNYGYDLDIQGEDLLKVGQIESTVVSEEFRGNRLQCIMCEKLELISRANKMSVICATASPYNEFSVNTFRMLGYEIKKDKLKYGGLRRYILAKELKS